MKNLGRGIDSSTEMICNTESGDKVDAILQSFKNLDSDGRGTVLRNICAYLSAEEKLLLANSLGCSERTAISEDAFSIASEFRQLDTLLDIEPSSWLNSRNGVVKEFICGAKCKGKSAICTM